MALLIGLITAIGLITVIGLMTVIGRIMAMGDIMPRTNAAHTIATMTIMTGITTIMTTIRDSLL